MNAKAECRIKGISPLLMNAFPMVPVEAIEKKPVEEQAELKLYRDPDGVIYVPAVAIQRSLVNAAVYSKGKGRGSLQKVVAACVMISPERCHLSRQKYDEIDARPVVIAATKGRVIRYRPRFNEWEVTFTAEWDPTLMTENQIRRVVDDAGSRVGLLDFRPERKGSFGRFMVSSWKIA